MCRNSRCHLECNLQITKLIVFFCLELKQVSTKIFVSFSEKISIFCSHHTGMLLIEVSTHERFSCFTNLYYWFNKVLMCKQIGFECFIAVHLIDSYYFKKTVQNIYLQIYLQNYLQNPVDHQMPFGENRF